MGYQVIKQPDDKLCLWSTEVDSIIITDATRDELIDWFVELQEKEARRQATRIVDLVVADKPREAYHQFAMTYAEAVERDRNAGTD